MKILFATIALCVVLSQAKAEYKINSQSRRGKVVDDDKDPSTMDETKPEQRIFGFSNNLETIIDPWSRGLRQEVKILTKTTESLFEDFKTYLMQKLAQLRDLLTKYEFYNLAALVDAVRKFVANSFPRSSIDRMEHRLVRRTSIDPKA
ncbi:uncharacterized protein LOC124410304 [Diprion similis]|uniref:uncharacterized protein LOC124410304 n=1 Tax=Diprion similis TaxID=362088 RepID=UPI001EF9A651|nr:uncharacterized protein LOC124410304 [Diprion similis]